MRFFLLLLCLPFGTLNAAPRVVTSIPPLQEITAAIMTGVGTPEAIIDNAASAHHFAFKPSHLRQLQQADLVIWIDRHFEAGFLRLADSLQASQQTLELLPLLELESSDGHIWYSPQLLLRSLALISAALQTLDPANQASYRRNAGKLSAAIAEWRRQHLAAWQQSPPRFITDHDFTTHFESDFGFTAIASIYDQHDSHGGIKKLRAIERLLEQNPAQCLLSLEHQVSGLARRLAQKYQLKIINPLQMSTDQNDQPAIIQRLYQLSSALLNCR